jgi:Rrf2 family protein
MTTQQIAHATRIPPDYLAKVMQSLGRGGLVQAQRGKHGGFTLARPAARLTILEVVNTVDPLRRLHACPLGLKAHRNELCSLHKRMDDAIRLIEQTLDATSIADLLADKTSAAQPLCNFSRAARA